jgi:hypothetical protein
LKIFTSYKDIANEKTLIQQLNALNYELELLKQQLTKINRLLNDTIVEKTKKEINLQAMEMQNQQQQTSNLDPVHSFTMKNYRQPRNDPLVAPLVDPQKPKIVRENSDSHNGRNSFNSRDLVREKRRASIGRTPNYAIYQAMNDPNPPVNKALQNSNDTGNYTSGPANVVSNGGSNNKTSAMERLFGSQRNIEQMIMNKPDYKKIAHVKPEIRNDEKYEKLVKILTLQV